MMITDASIEGVATGPGWDGDEVGHGSGCSTGSQKSVLVNGSHLLLAARSAVSLHTKACHRSCHASAPSTTSHDRSRGMPGPECLGVGAIEWLLDAAEREASARAAAASATAPRRAMAGEDEAEEDADAEPGAGPDAALDTGSIRDEGFRLACGRLRYACQ